MPLVGAITYSSGPPLTKMANISGLPPTPHRPPSFLFYNAWRSLSNKEGFTRWDQLSQ